MDDIKANGGEAMALTVEVTNADSVEEDVVQALDLESAIFLGNSVGGFTATRLYTDIAHRNQVGRDTITFPGTPPDLLPGGVPGAAGRWTGVAPEDQ